jgi:hypothetical protein
MTILLIATLVIWASGSILVAIAISRIENK